MYFFAYIYFPVILVDKELFSGGNILYKAPLKPVFNEPFFQIMEVYFIGIIFSINQFSKYYYLMLLFSKSRQKELHLLSEVYICNTNWKKVQ